jgi:hypothetical protein
MRVASTFVTSAPVSTVSLIRFSSDENGITGISAEARNLYNPHLSVPLPSMVTCEAEGVPSKGAHGNSPGAQPDEHATSK